MDLALLACSPPVRRLPLIAAALACLAAGCGSVSGEDRPGKEATLLLDFTPNAVHAGVYMAVELHAAG